MPGRSSPVRATKRSSSSLMASFYYSSRPPGADEKAQRSGEARRPRLLVVKAVLHDVLERRSLRVAELAIHRDEIVGIGLSVGRSSAIDVHAIRAWRCAFSH